jgi:uncharacterized protein (UPF0261 family)
MITTLAGGDVRGFVGVSDIVMIPAVVDISGLNRISREIFTRAAAAVSAMVDVALPQAADVPVVAASMFGNTTECVEVARASFERAGYEVLVFHATGTGGKTMEGLIESGYVAGVFDATITEWADELVGGVLTAGPTRLDAAARRGVPAVVAPGCLDMVNFWAPETIPERFGGRRFYAHNPNVTLMRTTPEENAELGRIVAAQLNESVGPVPSPSVGRVVGDLALEVFHWPEADASLFAARRAHLRPDIPVHALELAINDRAFADAMANGLLAMLEPAIGRSDAASREGGNRDAN